VETSKKMLVLTTHNEICGVMDWILIMLNGNGFPEFLTDLLGREKCKKKKATGLSNDVQKP
jgi:hypothetical protein